MNEYFIYRITNGETLRKWHAFYRVNLVLLLFLLLLVLLGMGFYPDDIVNVNKKTKMSVLSLPQDYAKEDDR